jgi:hypothetical protein
MTNLRGATLVSIGMHTLMPRRFSRFAGAAALTLAGALVSACNLHIGTGVEARENWTRTYTVKPGATLEVREANGRVRVLAVDGDTITVSAARVARADSDAAAKAALKDVTIAETATPDRVELDSTAPGITFAMRVSHQVDYDIKVPRSLNVTIKTSNGAVDVQGVDGALTVDATNGEISATGLGGSANVSTVNGKLDLAFAKIGEAGVQCRTTNGQIVVTIPRDIKATLAARVANGVVHTENLAMQATTESRQRIDAAIGGGGPEIRLQATNGEVRVVGR